VRGLGSHSPVLYGLACAVGLSWTSAALVVGVRVPLPVVGSLTSFFGAIGVLLLAFIDPATRRKALSSINTPGLLLLIVALGTSLITPFDHEGRGLRFALGLLCFTLCSNAILDNANRAPLALLLAGCIALSAIIIVTFLQDPFSIRAVAGGEELATAANAQAMVLAIGAILALGQPLRVVRWLVVPILVLGLLLTGSRGGLLSAVLGVCTYVLLSKQSRAGLLAILGLGLFLASLMALQDSIPGVARALSIREGLETGGGGRSDIYDSGLHLLGDYWLTGVGFTAFPDAIRPYLGQAWSPHSLYLEVTSELGIIGAITFVMAIAAQIRRAYGSSGGAVYIASLAAMCAGGLTLHFLGSPILWLLLTVHPIRFTFIRSEVQP